MITVLALLLVLLPGQPVVAGPSLASGNHVKWIDRIASLPDYARSFYTWLESNTGTTGALVDPTKGTAMSGSYVYKLHTLKGSIEVVASSDDQIQSTIMSAVDDDAQTVMDYAFDVYGAFDRDHPEVFWLDTECHCGMNLVYNVDNQTNVATYTVDVFFYLTYDEFDVRLQCYRDTNTLVNAITQRDKDIQQILSDCPTDQSAAEQVRYLNRVLTQINGYNSSAAVGDEAAAPDTAWKCVSALSGSVGKNGPVCEGYARAFKVLCDRLGIPCVLTEGAARASKGDQATYHMWNYVKIDGKWYAVDTTWNDPWVSAAADQAVSGKENEKYLLIGSQTVASKNLTFTSSHQVRNSIYSGGTQYTNGPSLSAAAYVFSAAEPEHTAPSDPKPTDPEPTVPADPEPGDPEPTVPAGPKPGDPEPTIPSNPQLNEPDQQLPDNYLDVAPYRRGATYTAPTRDGFVFTGWFMDPELTQPLDTGVTTGYAYAGFAPAELLSVKCQLSDGATAQSEQVDLRLLTAVCSDVFQCVVFHISWENTDLVANNRYEQVLAYGETNTASQLFGQDAAYIMTCTIADVPRARFNESITVTPGWYTLDGTFVAGISRTVCISDGF